MSVAEAAALRDAAKRTGAKGMVGFQRRFHPMVLEARAMIEERGPVTQILGEFHKSMTGTEASGKFPEVIMDNVLLETPIHSIDLVRAVAGSDVSEVHSVVRRAASSHKDVHARPGRVRERMRGADHGELHRPRAAPALRDITASTSRPTW